MFELLISFQGVYINEIVILYLIFKISILFSIVDTLHFYKQGTRTPGYSSFCQYFFLIAISFSQQPISYYGFDLHFSNGSAGKESACNAGYLGSIPGLGRSSGEEKGYPLKYSGLENSMGYIVHGVSKSWTGLSDFHWH